MDEPEDSKQEPEKEPTVDTADSADQPESDAKEAKASVKTRAAAKLKDKHSQLWGWALAHKPLSIPVAVLLLLAILMAIPFTRYLLAGTVVRRNFSVFVIDSQTHMPVTSATVRVGGKQALTNNQGVAKIRVGVGSKTLAVSKTYYRAASQSVLVPLGSQKQAARVRLTATGRQVPIVVVNKITGKAVNNAVVKAASTEVRTDAKGRATMVLPAGQASIAGTISVSGYNTASIKVTVVAQAVAANTFSITPSGKLYFLSNKTGTLDVVKTDLDGQNRQTVLAGTGNEDKSDTSLLASRDWKFLLLKSIRDGSGKAKLYLIDTSTDKLTTVDEGDAGFYLIGWTDHTFSFYISRNNVQYWQPNRIAVKSYNADTNKLATLDQTQAQGDQYTYITQEFSNFYQIGSQLLYTAHWNGNNGLMGGKTNAIRTIDVDGQNKKDLKTFDPVSTGYIEARLYKPAQVYFKIALYHPDDTTYDFYELEDGAIKSAEDVNTGNFYQDYGTFLLSPSGNQTFWAEQRDGKNSLFVGDKDAKNGKEIATLSDYNTYGWFTDQYLLESKNSSELYILPAGGLTAGQAPLKISDYYKPAVTYNGYGGGYGGL